MSAFSSLSEFWQTMLPFIMLVEIVLEIGLFMYQLLRSNKPVRSLLSLAVMAVMIRCCSPFLRQIPIISGTHFCWAHRG